MPCQIAAGRQPVTGFFGRIANAFEDLLHERWPRFGELVKEAEPCLYQVAHVEAA